MKSLTPSMRIADVWLAASLALGAFNAHAAVTNVDITDAAWQPFYFADVDSPWLDKPAFDDTTQAISFTVTVPSGQSVYLKVTDIGVAGDVFQVFDNGTLLGTTSVPTGSDSDDIGLDYDAAFADAKWSHSGWTLSAGTHVITGAASASPFGAGAGALQVAAVPEPQTYALLISGLALTAWVARRRTNSSRRS